MNASNSGNNTDGRLFVWTADDGLVQHTLTDDPLLAADSWLVEAGNMRAFSWHERRFKAACHHAGGVSNELDAFWTAATDLLPRRGRWFPRVELTAAEPPQLRLRIRPAPDRASQVGVSGIPSRDQRRLPRRKGPDLPWLTNIRGTATKLGAEEALLTTPTGLLLEATTSSILWWEGDILCVPSPAMRLLPGITTSLIQHEARCRGLKVLPRRCHLADLSGREVWLVNALHGIRYVHQWIGGDIAVGQPKHLRAWSRWWERLTR